jgi:hypothetical protein
LTISKAADPSKMRVQLVGRFDSGYIGFGVAKPGGGCYGCCFDFIR